MARRSNPHAIEKPAPRRRRPRPLRLALGAVVWSARIGWWTPVVAVVWGSRPYWLDLLSQFTPHSAVLVGAASLGLLLIGARRLAIESGVAFALLAVLCLGAHYGGPASEPPGPDEPVHRLTVVTYNAKWIGQQPEDKFSEWLELQEADLVCLFDPPWGLLQREDWLIERYPHRVTPERGLWWSIVLLSRFPIEPARLAPNTEETRHSFIGLRSVVAELEDGTRLVFTGTRPRSPRTREDWRRSILSVKRDAEIVREHLDDHDIPMIIAADMNSTPTGRLHRIFAGGSGLRTWGGPFGRGTWPAGASTAISLPIDRVWTTPDVRFRSISIGPRFNSDHRPVVVELEVPARSQRAPEG